VPKEIDHKQSAVNLDVMNLLYLKEII